MVLLKGHDADGFVFYTNMHSRKGEADGYDGLRTFEV
jgi:pyridoxine/pyridoxamine 5'-phosphate oxidase